MGILSELDPHFSSCFLHSGGYRGTEDNAYHEVTPDEMLVELRDRICRSCEQRFMHQCGLQA